MSHLHSLELKLSNERNRLADAKSRKEIEMRKFFVEQLEREVEGEKKFLEISCQKLTEMTDDEILNQLGI